MKLIIVGLLLATLSFAQNYTTQKMSCNAVPVSFVTMTKTTSGVETDMVVNVTANQGIGESTIVSSIPFVGVRYEVSFPAISKWIDGNTALAGYNLKFGIALTPGIVKTPSVLHWGERAGIFMKYSPGGSKNFNVGIEMQWNNLPGIQHNVLSLSVGPNFKW